MTRLPLPSELPISPRQNLPTMYDLPSEYVGEPALPDEFHSVQAMLLLLTFAPPNWSPDMVFSAIDLYLYYDVNHPLWYKRPDWFGVVGVPRLYEERDMRLSYVIWQEQVSPFVLVELLSPGTEDEDLGQTASVPGKPPVKWDVYEQILRVPYYVVFSRYTNELQAFHLVDDRYRPVPLTQGRLLIPELELSLGLWRGSYQSLNRLWLRWMTLEGDLIPLPEEEAAAARLQAAVERERAAAERERAAAERERADVERDRADIERERATAERERATAERERATAAEERAARLAARLREMGINPDELE